MKKTYIIPEMETVELKMSCTVLAGSGGVSEGSGVGDDYNSGDATYMPSLPLDF